MFHENFVFIAMQLHWQSAVNYCNHKAMLAGVQIHRHTAATYQQPDPSQHEQTASGAYNQAAPEVAAAYSRSCVEDNFHLWIPR